MRTMRLIAVAILGLSSDVFAGEYCWKDTVKDIIIKSNAIYFTSQKSCPNWCEINPSWNDNAKNRAYTQLLTAKTTNRPITFYWNEHEQGKPCQATLPTYSKPAAIMLN